MSVHKSTVYVELQIPVEVQYEIENTGIGHWECYGQGHDKGEDVINIINTHVPTLKMEGSVTTLVLDAGDVGMIYEQIRKSQDDIIDEIQSA